MLIESPQIFFGCIDKLKLEKNLMKLLRFVSFERAVMLFTDFFFKYCCSGLPGIRVVEMCAPYCDLD